MQTVCQFYYGGAKPRFCWVAALSPGVGALCPRAEMFLACAFGGIRVPIRSMGRDPAPQLAVATAKSRRMARL